MVHCVSIAQTYTPLVFVSRNIVQGGSQYFPQQSLLPGMGPFSRFSVVGGKLIIRDNYGTIRVLVDSTKIFMGIRLIDVSDPDVHWDGLRIVFAGIEHRDSCWRIYEIQSDGSGFRKITFTNRNLNLSQFGSTAGRFTKYDDIDPCYLPDGRICFASTRYPSISEFGNAMTTNLYVINSNGTGLHRITSERNGAEEPAVDPVTGKIVYSRWWLNIDMPSNLTANGLTRDSILSLNTDIANIWQAARIRPDGQELELFAGLPVTRQGLQTYKPFVTNLGYLLSVFVPYLSMVHTSGSTGIRIFTDRAIYPNHIVGVNPANMQLYIQNPPSYGTMQPPYATDPIEMPDAKILFSYTTQVVNQDYALYTINSNGSSLQLFYDIPGKMELNARVLLPRTVPPVLNDIVTHISDELPPTIDPLTYYKNGGFRFDCVNMFTNAAVDVPIIDAPPITRNARMKFFLNFQRQDSTGRDTAIFLTSVPVEFTGAVHLDIAPADVPMFEQVIDSTGRIIKGNRGQTAHVSGLNFGRPGTGTKCVGCHAGHTQIPVPQNISLGAYLNVSTSARTSQSSALDTALYSGKKVIDRKARNDSMSVNWIASGTENEFVSLKWEMPVDVRSLIIYNIRPNTQNNTNIQVTDCEVFLYLQNQQVYHIQSTGVISVNGSKTTLPSEVKTDSMKVIVKSFTGLIMGVSRAGLAEIETDAKISYYPIGIKKISSIAEKFSLSQNYPNPFNPVTKIKFSISPLLGGVDDAFGVRSGLVRLTIYDILGREAAVLVNDVLKPGSYEIEWDAVNFPSGVYFYQLTLNDAESQAVYNETKRMVLIK